MKLFEEVEKVEAVYGITEDNEKILLIPEKINMKMIHQTVLYLLCKPSAKTLNRIRYLIANLYDNHSYPNVELFSMIRDADNEHQELIMDIIGISQSKYGESYFLMINELAPHIIHKFFPNEIED